MLALTDVLVRPVVTEKSVATKGRYAFVVHPEATKTDVAKAIKEFYGVETEKVNMSPLPAKTRIVGRGRTIQKRGNIRKAIVSLKGKKTLEFNAFK